MSSKVAASLIKRYGKDYFSTLGKKGGKAVASKPGHMAKIGRKGGLAVSEDLDHMSEIGRKGGAVARVKKNGNDSN